MLSIFINDSTDFIRIGKIWELSWVWSQFLPVPFARGAPTTHGALHAPPQARRAPQRSLCLAHTALLYSHPPPAYHTLVEKTAQSRLFCDVFCDIITGK